MRPKGFLKMDMDLLKQTLATRIYTAAVDIAQQTHPINKVDAYIDRTKRLTQAVAEWVVSLSAEELAECKKHAEYLSFERWTLKPADDYDDTAICMAVQTQIFHAQAIADHFHIDAYELIHGAGEYLLDADDHKAGWLAERAANLMLAYMPSEVK